MLDDFIIQHRQDDVATLALQLNTFSPTERTFVLQQIEGWQRLSRKVPSWAACQGLHYPPRLSLEQCSGEAAARYKAQIAQRLLPQGGSMADITGGLGVDFSCIARHFSQAYYVERHETLTTLAAHNFPLLGLTQANIITGDGTEFLRRQTHPLDLVYIDPARRDAVGRKVVHLSDCSPDVERLLPLLAEKARFSMVKLSPMLDWKWAVTTLRCVSEVHIFAEKGEVKDLLLVLQPSSLPQGIPLSAVQLYACDGNCISLQQSDEDTAVCPFATRVEAYLYEPSPALLKLGAYKWLAASYHLKKLHPNSHLYTSDTIVPHFPGRSFKILRQSNFSKQQLKTFKAGITQAHLTVRNFPQSPATLAKRLRITEGGHEYWFATTLSPQEHLLLATEKITPSTATN